jgi:hypothetical protein
MPDYPAFSAQSVADGYWEVYHEDNCDETFDWFGGGKCLKCGFRPDLQSIAARKTPARRDIHSTATAIANGPAGDPRHRECTTEKCFAGGDCPVLRTSELWSKK